MFRDWFKENLSDSAEDIATHGADVGYPLITYNSDGAKLFDQFQNEIWSELVEDSEDLGYENVYEFIATFNRADMGVTLESHKTLLIWYMCEKVSNELIN